LLIGVRGISSIYPVTWEFPFFLPKPITNTKRVITAAETDNTVDIYFLSKKIIYLK